MTAIFDRTGTHVAQVDYQLGKWLTVGAGPAYRLVNGSFDLSVSTY